MSIMDCILPYILVGMILLAAGSSNGLPCVTEEENREAVSPMQVHCDTRSTDETLNVSDTSTCPLLSY